VSNNPTYADDNGVYLPGRTFRKSVEEMPTRVTVVDPRVEAEALRQALERDVAPDGPIITKDRFGTFKDWRKWETLNPEQQTHIVKAVTRLFLFKSGQGKRSITIIGT
jgi:hypothetical protein